MTNKEGLYDAAWHNTYVGISRASAIIYSVDAFNWTGNENKRNQLLGEAYFMRGLFYLWGVQFWGNIPAGLPPLPTPAHSRMQRPSSSRTYWPTSSVQPT